MIRARKRGKRPAAVLLAILLLLSALPTGAFAATVDSSYTPGTYSGTAEGDYGNGTVTVSLTINDSYKISEIEASSSRTAETAEGGSSSAYWKNAIANVLGAIQTNNGTDSIDVDAVTTATLSGNAMLAAADDALSKARSSVIYVDGSNGDNGNSGGAEAPVATFDKAKELLGSREGSIYVTGTLTVLGSESWSLEDGQSLIRGEGFSGDLVSVASGGSLVLSDITIDGGLAEDSTGSLIAVENGGTLAVQDGAVLQNNVTTGAGGGVNNAGTMSMTGGTIQNNTAASGGGVSLSGSLSMEGGSISGNCVTGTGGGVDASRAGSFLMTGGSITQNTADSNGGGVYLFFTTLEMSGGSIAENTAASGGGLYGWLATLALSGSASITDNTAAGKDGVGGVDGMMQSFTVQDSVRITGSVNLANENSNTALSFTVPAAFGANAAIYVTGELDTAFASGAGYSLTTSDAAKCFSDASGLVAALDADANALKFVAGSADTLLAAVYLNGVSGDGANDGAAPETAVKTFAQAKALLAENGTIYITDMVTVTGAETWTLSDKGAAEVMRHSSYTGQEPEDGHDYVNGPLVEVNGWRAALTLEDITLDGNQAVEAIAGLTTVKQGSLTINEGTVLKNANSAQHNGGAVYIYADGSAVMNGGTITGNYSAGYGGGVFNAGTFALNGGSVTGNTAGYNVGGIHNSGVMTMQGAVIVTDNVLAAGGSEAPSDLYMASGKYISLTGALEDGASIKVDSFVKPANIARGGSSYTLTESDLAKFSLDDAGSLYQLTLDGNAINLRLTAEPDENAVYLDPALGDDTNSGLTENAPVKTLGHAADIAAAQEADTVYVMNPISVADTQSWQNDLALVRHFTYLGELVRVLDGGNLTLSGITLDGGKGSGLSANRPLVMVDSGGSLTITDGAALQNNSSLMEGGAVYNAGTLALSGGSVSGNDTQDGNDGGGGIFNEYGGVMTMTGGVIERNEAFAGAGIENEGALDIRGGEVRNNTSRGGGAGVHVWAEAGGTSFSMSGGAITENISTENNGGGLFVWQGAANLTGGSITNNQAYGGAGGIYVWGTVNVSGSIRITGNTDGNGDPGNATYMQMFLTGALEETASIGLLDTGAVASGSNYTLTEADAARFTSDCGHRVYLNAAENALYVAETGVTMPAGQISMQAGDSVNLQAQASLSAGYTDGTLVYSTSAPAVATVDNSGTVTGHTAGSALITVSNAYGETAVCSVTVAAKLVTGATASSITIAPADGMVYSIDGETWFDAESSSGSEAVSLTATGNLTFSGLTAGTTYTVYGRPPAAENASVTETVMTNPADADDLAGCFGADAVTVSTGSDGNYVVTLQGDIDGMVELTDHMTTASSHITLALNGHTISGRDGTAVKNAGYGDPAINVTSSWEDDPSGLNLVVQGPGTLSGGDGYPNSEGENYGGEGICVDFFVDSTPLSITVSNGAQLLGGAGGRNGNGGYGILSYFAPADVTVTGDSVVAGGNGLDGSSGGNGIDNAGGLITICDMALISGGSGGNTLNGKTGNGGDAVSATNDVILNGSPTLTGGNGGNGGNNIIAEGVSGTAWGGFGIQGTSYAVIINGAATIRGGNGGDGGEGGNAGNGGFGIYTRNTIEVNGAASISGGKGGSATGTSGGNGGDGGTAIFDEDDVRTNGVPIRVNGAAIIQGGDGGNGADNSSGDGGKGGSGGFGIDDHNTEDDALSITGGARVLGGRGGNGGKAIGSTGASGNGGDGGDAVYTAGPATVELSACTLTGGNGGVGGTNRVSDSGNGGSAIIAQNLAQAEAVILTAGKNGTIATASGGNNSSNDDSSSGNGNAGTTTITPDPTPLSGYADVPNGHWAEDAIAWAKEQGYMTGTGSTAFSPNDTVTRQQMWMVLGRMAGTAPADMAAARTWATGAGLTDGVNPTAPMSRQQMVTMLYRYARQFLDLPAFEGTLSGFPDSSDVAGYAQEAMAWAIHAGIIIGTDDGRLDPGGTATRAQFAVVLQRFANTMV